MAWQMPARFADRAASSQMRVGGQINDYTMCVYVCVYVCARMFSFAILIITKHKRYLDVIYIYIYI